MTTPDLYLHHHRWAAGACQTVIDRLRRLRLATILHFATGVAAAVLAGAALAATTGRLYTFADVHQPSTATRGQLPGDAYRPVDAGHLLQVARPAARPRMPRGLWLLLWLAAAAMTLERTRGPIPMAAAQHAPQTGKCPERRSSTMDIQTHRSVQELTFAQLSPPAASHALVQVQQALPESWWDHHDTDGLVEAITQRLARELGHDNGRLAEICGFNVTCWDVDTGGHLTIRAVLDASNAPALPWNGAHQQQLSLSGPPFTVTTHPDTAPAQPDQLSDAALAAMAAAWQAGHAERDRRVKRNVLDWIAGAQPRFTADGTLLTHRPREHTHTEPMWDAAEHSW